MHIDRLYNQESLDTFIINGAIGDFLLFDSLLTNQIRKRIKKIIIWNPFHPINPKGKLIEKMIKSNFDYNPKTEIKIISYPKLNSGINPANNLRFSHDMGWLNSTLNSIIKSEKLDHSKTFIQHRMFLESTKNYKSLDYFKKMVKDSKAESSYITRRLTNSIFKHDFMREKYCVIVPYTSPERTFKPWDLSQALKILDEVLKMPGIVLTGHKINIDNKNIINLAQKTTINESIEITKNAAAYIGVDSFLSIIATECIPENYIAVKAEFFGINHPYFYNKIKYIKKIMYPFINCDRFKKNIKKHLKF